MRPTHCHYYFGDYFEAAYERRGFVPWVDYRIGRQATTRTSPTTAPRSDDEMWANEPARFVRRPPRGNGGEAAAYSRFAEHRAVQNLTTNRTANVTVNKTINITHLQNISVLSPITKINNTHVTALAALGRDAKVAERPRTGEAVPTRQTIRLTTVDRDQRAAAMRHVEEVRRVSQQRRQEESRVAAERTKASAAGQRPGRDRTPGGTASGATPDSAPRTA